MRTAGCTFKVEKVNIFEPTNWSLPNARAGVGGCLLGVIVKLLRRDSWYIWIHTCCVFDPNFYQSLSDASSIRPFFVADEGILR